MSQYGSKNGRKLPVHADFKQENSVLIMREDDSKNSIFQLKSVHHWFSDVIVQLSSVQIVSVQSSWQYCQKFKYPN